MKLGTLSRSAGIVAGLCFLAGCGGGGSEGGGGTGPTPPPPAPEVITITTPATIQCVQAVPFSLTLQAQGNSGPLSWSVTGGQLPGGLSLNSQTGVISGTPSADDPISGAVVIQAADAKASGALQFYFLVYNKLTINPVVPTNAHIHVPYSLSVAGQGDSQITSWTIAAGQLPPGLMLGPSGQANSIAIAGTPTQVGSYSFTIQAQDSVPQKATLNLTLVVDSHLGITKSSLKNGGQNQAYSDSFMAVNGTQPYQWSVTPNLPAGLTLDPTAGTITGTPAAFGSFNYTVTVADSSAPTQTDSAQNTLSIVQQLQISAVFGTAYLRQQFIGNLIAIGGTGPYSWSIASGSLPPGLTLDGAGGQLSGTPTQLGTYNFVVQVTDSGSPQYVVTQPLTLAVVPAQLVVGAPLSPAPVNVVYHSQIPVSGGTPPYTMALTSGVLPPGLTFDPTTGFIDGTPTQVGTDNFVVTVGDTSSPVQTSALNQFITIRNGLGRNDSIATATPLGNTQNANPEPLLSISPYIDPISAPTPNPDTDYFRLVASGGSVVHVETFAQRSFGSTPLDTVIELLDQGGNRLSSCTQPSYNAPCLNDDLDSSTLDSAVDFKVPGAANTTTTFYAHVLDWRGDARPDMQYYLNISGVVEPLTISPATLGAGATRGVGYTQQFTATGGIGSVAWSLDGGTLPPGWSLSASGLLSGTATTDGQYAFTIKATDSANPPQTTRVSYTLQIAEPVTITSPATFPNACANQPYSFTLQTSGGIPPIQFGFRSELWPSINLDGATFSGTTTATGMYTGLVSAVDSAQPSSGQGQTVTLTVVTCN